jgi:hypothetical protein
MIKIAGKKVGRPDNTIDNFITTSPVVIRHQARFLSAYIHRDISITIESNGKAMVWIAAVTPLYLRGTSEYYMWFGSSLSVYRKFEMQPAKIDLDKAIEHDYFGVPWTKEDIMVEDWGKVGGWGTVIINRGVNCPSEILYETDAPASIYIPNYLKYAPGVFLDIFGTPGESFVCDISCWFSGMHSKYPWWY